MIRTLSSISSDENTHSVIVADSRTGYAARSHSGMNVINYNSAPLVVYGRIEGCPTIWYDRLDDARREIERRAAADYAAKTAGRHPFEVAP